MALSATEDVKVTRYLGQWISQNTCVHSPDSVAAAERAVVDTVACIVAGQNDEAVMRVRKGLGGWGKQGASSAVGGVERIDAPWAALINGTSAHALDYDDVLDPAGSHISAVLVPALLALAQETGASGRALIDAFIVGVDIQLFLAKAVNMTHYTRGWHTTSTLGAPAAAAACARMLGLNEHASTHAISIATSLSGGFKRQFGTNTKPFHAGLAAKNGVLAARMAEAGLTADTAPLEGERGFLDLMVGPGAAGFKKPLPVLGAPAAVLRPGIWQKRYPCCASTHRAVDGVLALVSEHVLGIQEIKHIQTTVSEAAVRNLMYDRPQDPMQARFSMQYCIAAALIDGDLRLSTFSKQALMRPEVFELMDRITMISDPEQPHDMPATEKSWACVSIATNRGSWAIKVVDPKGYPDNPLSESELEAKFYDCCRFAGVHGSSGDYDVWRFISRSDNLEKACSLF
ncbi:MAG: MmgE/PrpD family protein [Burkholderiaceae bacterium]